MEITEITQKREVEKGKTTALDLQTKFWPRLRRSLRRGLNYYIVGKTRIRLARMAAYALDGAEFSLFDSFSIEGGCVARVMSECDGLVDLLASEPLDFPSHVRLQYTGVVAEELRTTYGNDLYITPAAYVVAVPVVQQAA
jgi:hypothetical protein